MKSILKCGIVAEVIGYIIWLIFLNCDLLNENTLADAIKGKFKFEYELDSELYEKLIKTEDLKGGLFDNFKKSDNGRPIQELGAIALHK